MSRAAFSLSWSYTYRLCFECCASAYEAKLVRIGVREDRKNIVQEVLTPSALVAESPFRQKSKSAYLKTKQRRVRLMDIS